MPLSDRHPLPARHRLHRRVLGRVPLRTPRLALQPRRPSRPLHRRLSLRCTVPRRVCLGSRHRQPPSQRRRMKSPAPARPAAPNARLSRRRRVCRIGDSSCRPSGHSVLSQPSHRAWARVFRFRLQTGLQVPRQYRAQRPGYDRRRHPLTNAATRNLHSGPGMGRLPG